MSDDIDDGNDPHDDEMEQILRQVRPRGAGAALRSRVLAGVAGQLRAPSRPRWERVFWPAAAAAILLGVLLNYWVAKRGSERLARIMGPPAVSKRAAELAADIAAVTDEATGRWAYERLAACCRPPNPLERSGVHAQNRMPE